MPLSQGELDIGSGEVQKPRRRWLMVTAVLALAGFVVAGILSLVMLPPPETPVGTLLLRVDPPDDSLDVQLDGQKFVVADLREPLRLAPGVHHLSITCDDFEPSQQKFTVEVGDNPLLEVKLVPLPPAPGLVAELYQGMGFDYRIKARIDRSINFNWETNAADPEMFENFFSVRWVGVTTRRE